MSHRIREAMASLGVEPIGGEGAVVEIFETFIGKKDDVPGRRGYAHKPAALTLVEWAKGSRCFHVSGTAAADILPVIKAHVAVGTAGQYVHMNKHFT